MTRLEAISDPVRLRLVHHLEGAGEASLQQLADAARVHLNTARPHLAALERAGVIERQGGVPAGRGRPAHRYRPRADWALPTTDFPRLAALLAAAARPAGARPASSPAVR